MGNLVRILLDKMRMVKEDAVAVAHVVEEAFRGQAEVEDELLDKHLRQVFYDLQDEKILEIRRAETREAGLDRRHYYWRVRDPATILDIGEPIQMPDPAERVYRKLKDDVWERKKASEPEDSIVGFRR